MRYGESNLALITVPVDLVDNNGNPVTGFVPAAHELQVSYSGAALSDAPGTLVEIGGGAYYYQGTVADASREGFLVVVIVHTGVRGGGWAPVEGRSGVVTFPLQLLDLDGAPATGVRPTGSQLQMSLNGAALVNASGTFAEIGYGVYYYTHDVVLPIGFVLIRVNVAGYRPAIAWSSLDQQPTAGSGIPLPGPPAVAAGSYATMMMALLPPGRLWRFVSSALAELFAGCADELGRFDARMAALLTENDPTKTLELLPEYESELGLTSDGTNAQRQARVTSQLVSRQGFRPVDLQNALAPLLALVPSSVVVIERTPSQATAMGDVREIFRYFVYRNPALAGTYYLANAQSLLDKIEHSHTIGCLIESTSLLCDDAHSLTDRDILGA